VKRKKILDKWNSSSVTSI